MHPHFVDGDAALTLKETGHKRKAGNGCKKILRVDSKVLLTPH